VFDFSRRTKIIVDDFGKARGIGETLQEKLKQFAETKENWVCVELSKFPVSMIFAFHTDGQSGEDVHTVYTPLGNTGTQLQMNGQLHF